MFCREGAEGDEGEAAEGLDVDAVGKGEYCAAAADADMQCDLDRHCKSVLASLQKAELIAAKKAKVEATMVCTTRRHFSSRSTLFDIAVRGRPMAVGGRGGLKRATCGCDGATRKRRRRRRKEHFFQTVPKVQACSAAHSMGGRLTTGIYHASHPV